MNYRRTTTRPVNLLTCLALLAVGPASPADRPELDVTGGITAVYQNELATEAHDASISGDLHLTLAAGGGTWVMYLEGASGSDADSIFDTDHAELWFWLPLGTDALHGTLSLQYVANPGFDASNVGAQANALLAGLRIDYAF